METEEAQFLRTLRELPNDDMPRLVYADWLEENGRAERAEFIRLQCALSATDDDEPRRPLLQKRERRLWQKFAGHWRAELPNKLRRFSFQRGFVQPPILELSISSFLSLSNDYLDASPQWMAKLVVNPNDPLPALAGSKHLERLTDLRMHVLGAETAALGELLGSPKWHNLRSLQLEGHFVGPDQIRAIAQSPAMTGLRRLSIFCNRLQSEGAEAIAASPYLRDLESLDLTGCGIGEKGLRALASSPNLRRLKRLNLPQNRLDDSSASAIIASRSLKNLVKLGLFGNNLGDGGARALARARNLERLTQLDLGLNRIGPQGGRALADSPFLLQIRELYLGGNRLGDDPIALVALRSRFGGRVTV